MAMSSVPGAIDGSGRLNLSRQGVEITTERDPSYSVSQQQPAVPSPNPGMADARPVPPQRSIAQVSEPHKRY